MHNKYSEIKVRPGNRPEKVVIKSGYDELLRADIIDHWQSSLDLIADIAQVPIGLIMRLNEDTIEVFVASNTEGNPYKAGEKDKLVHGLYCETVIGTQQKLFVPDALKSETWKANNPDADKGVISYLGFPVNWPDGEVFGTICLLDKKENHYSDTIEKLALKLKVNIETSLALAASREKISQSEIRFRGLFENMVEGFALYEIITDEKGNPKDAKILELNRAFLKLTGLTKKDTEEKNIFELFPKRAPEALPLFTGVAMGGESVEYETYSGDFERYFRAKLFSPALGQVAVLFDDITERKKTEESVRKSEEKFRRLNEEKDKFFSVIAHDLRSPFHSLFGLVELVVNDKGSLTIGEIQRFLREIYKSGENLYELLENLLEWANMKRGVITSHPEVIFLKNLINYNVNFLSLKAEQKEIRLTAECPPELEVIADKHMTDSVLRNLISNALKFTKRKGVVAITAEPYRESFVKISVTDNGVGMSPEYVARLFKTGEKIGLKGTEEELSSGLGLLLCKDFVGENGGEIWVKSEEGKGSTFNFTLPAKQ